MHGDHQLAQQCFMMATKVQKASETLIAKKLTKGSRKKCEPAEQQVYFPLKDDSLWMRQVGSLLPEEERNQLLAFLWHNTNIFAWSLQIAWNSFRNYHLQAKCESKL